MSSSTLRPVGGRRADAAPSRRCEQRFRPPRMRLSSTTARQPLLLATTALAAGREVVVSRGEIVEIGDGFRLPDLIESTGARLHEVGTTNRVRLADYADAIGPATGCILKVHPSNFRIEGFTAEVPIRELATLPAPVVADVGSGLLAPDSLLPDEPDVASGLTAGADLVTASGDKLVGGPQAGLVFGRAELVERLRRHPLARAVRIDKLRLAALEATVRGPRAPVAIALHTDAAELRARCERLADSIAADDVRVVEATGQSAEAGRRAGRCRAGPSRYRKRVPLGSAPDVQPW